MEIKILNYPNSWEKIYNIRKEVFIIEQNVPKELEIDEYDKSSKHFLVIIEGLEVATLRIHTSNNIAKIGRLAVKKTHRKNGIARKLMLRAIEYIKNSDVKLITLDSQVYIKNFYKSLGFKEQGSEFMDAGIEHIKMTLEVF